VAVDRGLARCRSRTSDHPWTRTKAGFVGRDPAWVGPTLLAFPVSDVGLDVEAEAPNRGCDKGVIPLPADRVVIGRAGVRAVSLASQKGPREETRQGWAAAR
jgi:hypothetical protein